LHGNSGQFFGKLEGRVFEKAAGFVGELLTGEVGSCAGGSNIEKIFVHIQN
jgi:hypothetical protein